MTSVIMGILSDFYEWFALKNLENIVPSDVFFPENRFISRFNICMPP